MSNLNIIEYDHWDDQRLILGTFLHGQLVHVHKVDNYSAEYCLGMLYETFYYENNKSNYNIAAQYKSKLPIKEAKQVVIDKLSGLYKPDIRTGKKITKESGETTVKLEDLTIHALQVYS